MVPEKTGSANSAAATLRNSVKRLSYNARIIISFLSFNSKNSPGLIVLLSHYYSWKSWPRMRNLSHRGTSFSIPCWYQSLLLSFAIGISPCWYQSLSCVIRRRVHKCFHLAIIFRFAAAKILLQRWERTMTNRQRIPLI